MEPERSVPIKIETQHQLLESSLAGALRALEHGELDAARKRASSLGRFLESHLSLEEQVYFPQKLAEAPQLGDAIEELLADHTALRAQLADVSRRLVDGACAAAENHLKAFAATFRRHEIRELDALR